LTSTKDKKRGLSEGSCHNLEGQKKMRCRTKKNQRHSREKREIRVIICRRKALSDRTPCRTEKKLRVSTPNWTKMGNAWSESGGRLHGDGGERKQKRDLPKTRESTHEARMEKTRIIAADWNIQSSTVGKGLSFEETISRGRFWGETRRVGQERKRPVRRLVSRAIKALFEDRQTSVR